MFESLVSRRFATLKELKEAAQKLTNYKITTCINLGKPDLEGIDNEILIEFANEQQITFWYLKDNANNYYITEVQ